MTKLYAPNEKSRAICPHCAKLVATTFAYRDVPFDDGTGTVKDILVAVCDECEAILAVPAQSTVAIRRAREAADISLEVSLKAPELDILDAAAFQIDPQATSRLRKAIFTYYLRRLNRDPEELNSAKDALTDWIAIRDQMHKLAAKERIPNRRISFKLAPRTDAMIHEVMTSTGWNKTKLVRGVVMMAENEILKNKTRKPVMELREIAAAVSS